MSKVTKPVKDDLSFSLADIRKAIPAELFVKDELRFLVSVGFSVSLTLILMYLAKEFVPFTWILLPFWVIYALITGCIATGVWVLGHECGHGSFSNNQILNDTLGYILHTILLVPYFSWQHSHAVHHSKTNHLTEGETHTPQTIDSKMGKLYIRLREIIGVESFSLFQIFNMATIGWPLYLLIGVTGAPDRGFTSHFIVPNKLFPPKYLVKVHVSTLGLVGMVYLLYLWAQAASFAEVLCVYIGPYLVVNMWLVLITYLQHTDIDVPHYDATAWTWLKGALCTIDRNYPPFVDHLQHYIGTTHVLHHIFSDLPHYNAKMANIYLKQVIGDKYNQDNKNLLRSLFESSKLAAVEPKGNGIWKFI